MTASYACYLVTSSLVCSLLVNSAKSASLSRDEMDRSATCRSQMGYKYYFDHGTEHCEQCREICQNAKLMRTEEQCDTECPQYMLALRCADKEDQYFDENVEACSPCSELCNNHQNTGNTRACREHCSAYLEKLTPMQVPSHHKQNYLKAVDGSDSDQTAQTLELLLHPGWIAAMVVGGVALVCVVVVVIVLYWTCSQQQQQQQYAPAPPDDADDGQVGGQRNTHRRPVEETSQGTLESQHFAIDTASRLPPTAFSDLPDNRTRGDRV